MGLICVSLTERKRVKRPSEAIKRRIGRNVQRRRKTCTQKLSTVISLCFLALTVALQHSDKPSDDPASSPDPLWKHRSLSL